MDEPRLRPCKFGGVECTRSDRGRADCYVCSDVRAILSTLSRLQREYWQLADEVRRLRADVAHLNEEKERACRALGVVWEDVLAAA